MENALWFRYSLSSHSTCPLKWHTPNFPLNVRVPKVDHITQIIWRCMTKWRGLSKYSALPPSLNETHWIDLAYERYIPQSKPFTCTVWNRTSKRWETLLMANISKLLLIKFSRFSKSECHMGLNSPTNIRTTDFAMLVSIGGIF